MDLRYTFRDLLVYLLTGLLCGMMILLAEPDLLKAAEKLLVTLGEKEITLVVVLIAGIPLLYIGGHLVQIVDLVLSFHAPKVFKKYRSAPYAAKKAYLVHRMLYYFFASSTAEFWLIKRGIDYSEFSKMKYSIIYKDKNNEVEYMYLIKDLFNCLRAFTFFLVFYLLFTHHQIWLIATFSVLYFIFWIKAYNAAKNYTYAVTGLFQVMPPIGSE
ncbi:hypothetical protein [Pedobacter aquatilis]|uniref:hypothetical protein n=1 Tax=Pedobacter aquatilis TaxID=351343 RepID=UPI00292EE695|nr:hypothetical protein [Pedobacter aquatilis]